MKFFVIGDKDTLLGFQLVGLEGEEVRTAEQAQDALKRAFQIEDIGIIIITERIASTIRKLVDQYVYTKTFPLIIEIPDREGPIEGRKSIRQLIRSAVGVHL